jgi:hypothetical protein
MAVKYVALMKNQTWDLVPLPKGKNLVGCKWVYKTKYDVDGRLEKHKACLVAKGFSQKEGINYLKTFAPVACMDSIWMILSIVASLNWEVH